MQRRVINPWSWQDQYGFVQANEISEASQMLICSGQTAIDADGNCAHTGDMGGQARLSLKNLETVLGQAGYSLADVVRLTVYTTDVPALFEVYGEAIAEPLAKANCRPAQTLLGVAALALPDLMVEFEATAMR